MAGDLSKQGVDGREHRLGLTSARFTRSADLAQCVDRGVENHDLAAALVAVHTLSGLVRRLASGIGDSAEWRASLKTQAKQARDGRRMLMGGVQAAA
jgi:hypothetical protein